MMKGRRLPPRLMPPALIVKPHHSARKQKRVLPSLAPVEPPPHSARPVRFRGAVRSHPQYPTLAGAPLDPSTALSTYSELLTDRERAEIRDFREIFYIRQANPSPQSYMVHDPDFFPFIADDHIRYQFQQIAELGRGAFGSVIKCYDHKNQRVVAVKLVRETQRLARQIEFERGFLQLFLSTPTSFSHHIAKVFDVFKFRSFAVFVFEVLSCDLYTYLKSIKFKGLEMPRLQSVVRQLADSLDFLHNLGIVHCDIKPENILWTGPRRLSVKLIDFGCACRAGHTLFSYIQSRFYRAPEVVFGLGYDRPIDVWSLGCVIGELVNGRPLFPAHNEAELLAMIIAVLGLPPDQMIIDSPKRAVFFETDGSCKCVRGMPKARPMASILRCNEQGVVSLVEHCLRWDPEDRITVPEILAHPWVRTTIKYPW